MVDDDNTHQIFKDIRALNSYPEDMAQSEIMSREGIRLSMLDPVRRAHHIRDVENKVMAYDAAKSNLRTQAQGWRLVQTLKTADARLRAAKR